jgi:hypothetical protein
VRKDVGKKMVKEQPKILPKGTVKSLKDLFANQDTVSAHNKIIINNNLTKEKKLINSNDLTEDQLGSNYERYRNLGNTAGITRGEDKEIIVEVYPNTGLPILYALDDRSLHCIRFKSVEMINWTEDQFDECVRTNSILFHKAYIHDEAFVYQAAYMTDNFDMEQFFGEKIIDMHKRYEGRYKPKFEEIVHTWNMVMSETQIQFFSKPNYANGSSTKNQFFVFRDKGFFYIPAGQYSGQRQPQIVKVPAKVVVKSGVQQKPKPKPQVTQKSKLVFPGKCHKCKNFGHKAMQCFSNPLPEGKTYTKPNIVGLGKVVKTPSVAKKQPKNFR